ncbi:DNA recombination protein RmuC [Algoriphagus halophytocola]|uniref:DNA recombination protein RmuC n=1 Tax=Algoriphagus halophytocola TaxID=2991499 RepID=A0ABY6MM52_9BACT|nr:MULTISPECIES: DNA recombination protein RmuC [unclassified Algoriphagus]UZD23761.1 DNA recombination protein RmuC [Algoriphagus sp. TR-M5]WBL45055.1 DNA recombination protein RmuC [Algoriphagus sp. TR-M9]
MSIEFILLLVVFLQLVLLILFFIKSNQGKDQAQLQEEMDKLSRELERALAQSRKESNENMIHQFQLVFNSLRASSKDQNEALKSFGELFRDNVKEFNALQKEKFEDLNRRQEDLMKTTELRLERIRETVDEKLQKTLETRLGQSFEMVSNQLQAVQKGLGEMKNLANGVGDLKRVLTNVKSRGVLGEYQLQAILENMLAPDQYILNADVGKGGRERVEFAVKMPGQSEPVLLPIDSKFPQESYLRLVEAYDNASKPEIELYRTALFKAVKKAAADIQNKYIHPPHTTDFAILFLPVESLYAEILREPGLSQQIQQDFKVMVTGPTTLSAILNSLQMGFRTLAIQKRSSEVWQILGAIKTEFGKFGDLIEKTQKKLTEANSELDKLVGTRTRVIQRKLKDVHELPEAESSKLLEE